MVESSAHLTGYALHSFGHKMTNHHANVFYATASNGIPTSPPVRAAPVPQSPTAQPLPSQAKQDASGSDTVAAALPSTLSDNRNIVRRKLTGYVGFANLPNQWHRKSVRKGFNFNVMVVGM